jgi:hypothetical protein
LLEIELLAEGTRVAKGPAAASASDLTLTLDRTLCETDGRNVVIRLDGGHRHVEQTISLGDLPVEGRPRALALAVAEAIRAARASWQRDDEARAAALAKAATKLVNDVAPPTPIVLHAPMDAGRPPGPDPVARSAIEALGAWRIFAPQRTSLFGAQFAFRVPLGNSPLLARFDGGGYWASLSDRMGEVELASYSGGLALLTSVGRAPTFSFGPHFELGYASAQGTSPVPSFGNSGGHVLAAMSFVADIRMPVSGPWVVMAEAEAGSTLSGLNVWADNRTIAAMRGAFGCVRAGLAFAY